MRRNLVRPVVLDLAFNMAKSIIPRMFQILQCLLLAFLIIRPVLISPQIQPIESRTQPAGVTVRYHPDGGLLAGDQVSFEVAVPTGFREKVVEIQLDRGILGLQTIATSALAPDAMGGETAVFLWAWDTRGLSPGDYSLRFTIKPGNLTWTEIVHLGKPFSAASQIWQERDTQCCRIHTISGTAAARDIDHLAAIVDERARLAAQQLGYSLEQGPDSGNLLDINIIPRVLGQGGFTGSEVTVSYGDENYMPSDIGIIIQHELIHRMDAALGGDYRPIMLAEGLAVYLTGGHYKMEPVVSQAAILAREGKYLPLTILSEDFYSHQHEESYLEAASLITYMVQTWGWTAFNQFYRDIHQQPNQNAAQAINEALQRHFGISLQDLDLKLISWLMAQPVLPDMRSDLNTMVDFFNAVRDYQKALDPSAYFREVWLPDPAEMRKRGIVADYLRGPQDDLNLRIIAYLKKAGQSWRNGQYLQTTIDLWQVHQVVQTYVKKESLSMSN